MTKKNVKTLHTLYLCLKIILSGLLNKCKQNKGTNLVYITKKSKLSMLPKIVRLTLTFRLFIENGLLKIWKQ